MPSYTLVPCLLCGAPGEELATAEEMKAEVEALWEFHGRRLRADVPPQRLADRLAFSQRPPLRLAHCAPCGMIWRNPGELPAAVVATYEGETPAPETLAALHDTQLAACRAQAARLTRAFGGTGDVLEVGSYVGGFLSAARERGWRAEGVDVNEAANAHARSRGHHVTRGELADVDASRTWDAIALWNCLDQLPNPRATLRDAHARLREGGLLVVRVPNGGSYLAAHRRARGRSAAARLARGWLAHNNLLGFPYRWGFTPRALAVLLRDAGFRAEREVGDVLVPLADRWTRRWARAEERATKAAMRLVARARPALAPWVEVYARK